MSIPPSNKTLRVALQNVGCKLNTYEVEALANRFDHRGYEIVPFGAQGQTSAQADTQRRTLRMGRTATGDAKRG